MGNKFLIIIAIVTGSMGCQSAATQHKQAADTLSQAPAQPQQQELVITNPELKKQADMQAHLDDEGGGSYHYQEQDMNAALPVIAEILKAKGYVPPAKDIFQKKLQEIFAENFLPGNSCRVKEYGKFTMLWEGPLSNKDYQFPLMTDDISVSKEYQFITHIPLISGLGTFTDNEHFKIDLAEKQTLVSINKYLFNDSKADLDTLIQKNDAFVTALVKSYGYTKDPKLNDLVMKEFLTGGDDHAATVAGIIFRRDCKQQLVIREGLLNWVKDHTNKDEHQLLDALYNFVFKLYEDNNNDYTLNEKRKIAAYVDNIFIPLHDKFGGPGWPSTELIFNLEPRDKGIQDYLKQQNYFNLPAVKDLYGE
ncbi:hypothetical protein [Chitinophaga sp.]|uniref:hypothetical protein n=1 Tax=Chitinophaga sp. TaxID=1869181 RepID=UPI0031E0F594